MTADSPGSFAARSTADGKAGKRSQDRIAVEPHPRCVVCGGCGDIKYDDLPDRLFGTPGRWCIRGCHSTDCGALWLDPRPTVQDIGKAYASYYTHGVADPESIKKRLIRLLASERAAVRFSARTGRLPRWIGRLLDNAGKLYPGVHEHLDLLIRYMEPPADARRRLLDVGCGDGEALTVLRDLGWSVTGVDLDPKAVDTAKRLGLDVRLGDLASAAFFEDSFDAICSSHGIEHVHDPLAFLAESRRVLRPGGRVVAVTPNARAWLLQRHGRNWLNLDSPRHLMVLTGDALASLAKRAGLRNVQVTATARAVALAEIASSCIRDVGTYRWGARPALNTWLRAQCAQRLASKLVPAGRMEGEELVLIAQK